MPFQLTSTMRLNQLADIEPLSSPFAKPEVTPPALAKDINVKLPPGLIGNPTPMPQCSSAQFFESYEGKENRWPSGTAIGVAVVTIDEPENLDLATMPVRVFNVTPGEGGTGGFGFKSVRAVGL
jgi:hypothetical protein